MVWKGSDRPASMVFASRSSSLECGVECRRQRFSRIPASSNPASNALFSSTNGAERTAYLKRSKSSQSEAFHSARQDRAMGFLASASLHHAPPSCDVNSTCTLANFLFLMT